MTIGRFTEKPKDYCVLGGNGWPELATSEQGDAADCVGIDGVGIEVVETDVVSATKSEAVGGIKRLNHTTYHRSRMQP
jgi:hypothetical protein